jgi:two-component system OmpR family sensor kinase
MSDAKPRNGQDSLAGRLTRTLIVWVGGVWLLCVLAVVWYVDREINNNFDNELVEVSHRVFDAAVQEFEKLGNGRTPASQPLIAPPQLFSSDALLYQLVDSGERVLLRAVEAPPDAFDVPLAPGFANATGWRVYTARHPSRPLYFQVADPLGERRHALNRTLVGLIVPLGAVLPLLALLLRNIARRELRVLKQLESEIAQRSGVDLSPIMLPGLPRELRSVGDHVNRLLERLAHALAV